MTEAQVRSLLPADVRGESPEERGADDYAACHELWSETPALYYMVEDGRLTRISAHDPKPLSGLGVGVGATEAEVRAAAGRSLIAEPHTYVSPPAQYLLAWTVPEQRGYVFETDENRIVRTMHAGSPSIRYVEGCL